MLFVIDNLKYDTDKMELVSEKCMYTYPDGLFGNSIIHYGKEVKLWRSTHNRWLLTYTKGLSTTYAITLTEKEAKNILIQYDIIKYEELFGELEEA